MICGRCHRPLRIPSPDGYGPVCRKSIAPSAPTDRDLFGYSIDRACAAASERIRIHVEAAAIEASAAIRVQFWQARRRLGIWS